MLLLIVVRLELTLGQIPPLLIIIRVRLLQGTRNTRVRPAAAAAAAAGPAATGASAGEQAERRRYGFAAF